MADREFAEPRRDEFSVLELAMEPGRFGRATSRAIARFALPSAALAGDEAGSLVETVNRDAL